MKQPYLLQTSPDTLILFDNVKDNFLADFHQAFAGCKVESEHENIFALFGTDAFLPWAAGSRPWRVGTAKFISPFLCRFLWIWPTVAAWCRSALPNRLPPKGCKLGLPIKRQRRLVAGSFWFCRLKRLGTVWLFGLVHLPVQRTRTYETGIWIGVTAFRLKRPAKNCADSWENPFCFLLHYLQPFFTFL